MSGFVLFCGDCPLWHDEFDSVRDEAVCLALSEEAHEDAVFERRLPTDVVRTGRGHDCTARSETLMGEAARREGVVPTAPLGSRSGGNA